MGIPIPQSELSNTITSKHSP